MQKFCIKIHSRNTPNPHYTIVNSVIKSDIILNCELKFNNFDVLIKGKYNKCFSN